MKQIVQNVRSGKLEIADVPCPQPGSGAVLVQTRTSLISAGTERMLVEFSKASLIQKARQKPEQVQIVLDMMKTNGILPTLEAVFRKLDEPLPLGYCNAGVVKAVGPDVHDLKIGDRVASNGHHAEWVCVPRNLCAKIPPTVSDEEAAFTVLGSIALQGMRLADPTFGERFMVFGLGLVGLLTVQLLRANGCEVLAVDLNDQRLKLAASFGASTVNVNTEDPVMAATAFSDGRGVDGVIVAADTKGDSIIHQAAESCRKRGRIILVGVVNLDLNRNDFYEKELTFQVSCSYGPGRYDTAYEQKGRDYPVAHVRWTEQRNFEAVLQAMSNRRLEVDAMITDRIEINDAMTAYKKVRDDAGALGILLQYPDENLAQAHSVTISESFSTKTDTPTVGVIGAGSFASMILVPALAKTSAHISAIASRSGVSARQLAAKYNAERATSDYRTILEDANTNAVLIAVQHNLHARFICEALAAGKHVFVEKPLCITTSELEAIRTAYGAANEKHGRRILMVGFNRRFSRHTEYIKKHLKGRLDPLAMTMTINAGVIPSDHWTRDPERGGGRIIGEACHFIDLLSYIAEAPVTNITTAAMPSAPHTTNDNIALALTFADGSIASLNYFANGSARYPKETLSIFNGGRILHLDNFRLTRTYGTKTGKTFRTTRQDKGLEQEIALFIQALTSSSLDPTPFSEIENVAVATISASTQTPMQQG